YDELLEDALKALGVHHVPQVLQQNFLLADNNQFLVLKLHGSRTDWQSVVLDSTSYEEFQKSCPLLNAQLNQNLRTHPLVFVGCSMRDPRLLGWLRKLSDSERKMLFGGRALMAKKDWNDLPAPDQSLLESANIKPIIVSDHNAIAAVLAELARRLAPLAVHELVFTITPGKDSWTVVGPTPEKRRLPLRGPSWRSTIAESTFRWRMQARKQGPCPCASAPPSR
ncbi:MAG: SIR2 family protein, partial [Polyangiaceae bacterium]|nr:SIR2 family protein [Polyangiaceae bacterium]